MMRPAVAYFRVSTGRQAIEGISLPDQIQNIVDYCKFADLDLIEQCSDALSGTKSHNRPGLQRALELTCQKKAVLVVYCLSRLARSTKDCIEISSRLRKAGADMVSLKEKIDTSSAMGEFFYTLLAAIAQLQAGQISERGRDCALYLHKKGRAVGHEPYGWRKTEAKMLVPVPEEQVVLSRILNLYDGGFGYLKISKLLNREGILSKKKLSWTTNGVRSVILRSKHWSGKAVA
jgi:site-specific DNA recombinase